MRATGEKQVREFPALSRMTMEHDCPLVFSEHCVGLSALSPLPPSNALEWVKVMDALFDQADGFAEGFQVPQVGAVVSGGGGGGGGAANADSMPEDIAKNVARKRNFPIRNRRLNSEIRMRAG